MVGGRAEGVQTLIQPALAQCLRLSERFFFNHLIFMVFLSILWSDSNEDDDEYQHVTACDRQTDRITLTKINLSHTHIR